MSEMLFSTFLMRLLGVVSSPWKMLHLCIVNVSEVIIKTVFIRICFRANSDIRLFTGTTTRSDGLKFKDLDHINDLGSVGDGSDDGGETPDPDGGSGGNSEAPDPAA